MVRRRKPPLLLSFLGDDFTGTTSTAEALAVSGVSTIIFVKPPTLAFLRKHFSKVQAVGVTGISRSLPTEKLEPALKPIFQKMRMYGAPLFLYKVCSTFDSSPEVGSIGKAIEIGKNIFSPKFVPILPAAPRFGRFTLFGNHFASLGENIFRLDRHPSMSTHPVTPMGESDLRRHLAKQTDLECNLVTILALDKGKEQVRTDVQKMLTNKVPLILFDTLTNQHLKTVCSVIWDHTEEGKTLFCVGSHELGYGFAEEWRRGHLLRSGQKTYRLSSSRKGWPILVISGSCASVTGRQIEWASSHGFLEMGIDPERLLEEAHRKKELERIAQTALSALKRGTSVVIHSAVGPNDPRISRTKKKLEGLGLNSEKFTNLLGQELGKIARKVVSASGIRRLVLAGGDTSGRITQTLGIRALQIGKSVGLPAPLCYAYSLHPEIHGLQIAFKGGQVGGDDYFHVVRMEPMPPFHQVAMGYLPR